MLSIYSSTSAGQAASYYSQGDYYSQESEGDLQAFFSGGLADTLGIEREFNKDTFAQLLTGKINDDIQVGRLNQGKIEHRTGWDLTFSAPKSVSVMALSEGGDKRLIEAHRSAVASTMRHIEENLAFIRKGVDGQQQLKKIDGLLYATFEHGTSRLLDPQLHSHNFVMNMGELAGEFRSLETKPIFDRKLDMGAFYRNELAALSHRLGYDLDIKTGSQFELACVPDAVIKQFSKRREEIKAAADERGLHGGKSMQRAALMTRENKLHADVEACQTRWAEESEVLGFSPEQHIPDVSNRRNASQHIDGDKYKSNPDKYETYNKDDHSFEQHKPHNKDDHSSEQHKHHNKDDRSSEQHKHHNKDDRSFEQHKHHDKNNREHDKHVTHEKPKREPELHIINTSEKEVNDKQAVCADLMISIDHFSQFEAAFKQHEVIAFTREHTLGGYTNEELEMGLKQLKTQGVIFDSNLTAIKGQAHYIVTHKALEIEKNTLSLLQQGKGAVTALYNERQIHSQIAHVAEKARRNGLGDGFTQGQADAFQLALSSSDQFIGVNGRAGTGKTFMQKELKGMLEGAGFQVRGMAPTGEAAQKLEKESGIQSSTIDSFLFGRELEQKRESNKGVQPMAGFSLKSQLAQAQQAKRTLMQKGAPQKQFWVLDEASLANTTHVNDVMQAAKKSGARVLFQGDTKQMGAVGWGNAFELLIQQGMKTAEMTQVMRQKTDEGKAAVKATLDHQYNRALNHLHDNVKTDSNAHEMIKDWQKLPKSERDKVSDHSGGN